MVLNVLIVVGIACFVGLAVLGHILLLGDLWRLWVPGGIKPKESHGGVPLRMPAE
jgi:hypothetical protein